MDVGVQPLSEEEVELLHHRRDLLHVRCRVGVGSHDPVDQGLHLKEHERHILQSVTNYT